MGRRKQAVIPPIPFIWESSGKLDKANPLSLPTQEANRCSGVSKTALATPTLMHSISRVVRVNEANKKVEANSNLPNQGTAIKDSDCKAEVQPGGISDTVFGRNSTSVSTRRRIKNYHKRQSIAIGVKAGVLKPATQSRLEALTTPQRTRWHQAKLQASEKHLNGFLVTENLARQDQKEKEQEDDEEAEENICQSTLNGVAHHIEPHRDIDLHTLNLVGGLDISEYTGAYGGHSRKYFCIGNILDVIYQEDPSLAAPALIVGIHVGELEHPSVYFAWLWKLKYLATRYPDEKDKIQERLKEGEKWVIGRQLEVMTPESIDKPAKVEKRTIAKDWYFDATAKDPRTALQSTKKLGTRLRILLSAL